jgi:hypothetical protein
MNWRWMKRMILFSLETVLASPILFARSKESDGFPDYTKLEYAKPMPPADQQVPERPGGSINVIVGQVNKELINSPEALPIPILHKAAGPDDSEPPMDGILESTTASVIVSTPTAKPD